MGHLRSAPQSRSSREGFSAERAEVSQRTRRARNHREPLRNLCGLCAKTLSDFVQCTSTGLCSTPGMMSGAGTWQTGLSSSRSGQGGKKNRYWVSRANSLNEINEGESVKNPILRQAPGAAL